MLTMDDSVEAIEHISTVVCEALIMTRARVRTRAKGKGKGEGRRAKGKGKKEGGPVRCCANLQRCGTIPD